MATLTVITPTVGRDSLRDTAASLVPQLRPGDEWILVSDGAQPFVQAIGRQARTLTPARIVLADVRHSTSQFGNAQRDLALGVAKGSHLCFLDDDDVWEPGARDHFAAAADQQPGAVHVFRARWGDGHHWHGILWKEQVFEQGNVGTPMVCYPNQRPLPKWMSWNHAGAVSDFGWMRAALGAHEIVWHREIVATVRPMVRP